MKNFQLIPDIPKEEKTQWVILEDTDVVKRRKLTLKEIKRLCEERDIDVLGPKGGQLSKQSLLKKLEVSKILYKISSLSSCASRKSLIGCFSFCKISSLILS